ncbi:MAG: cell division protein [Chitinophagaceae bacterium]|nr:MAG: cell division protein [Chitinophagaceae bacterium]
MPSIHLTTFVAAPVERVFDLARSIDLHKHSMTRHKEEAVAGTRFGLIEKGETVTWKAKHLFKTRFLRTRITDMERPTAFTDEQEEGDFRSMKHVHHFKPCENGTIMIDKFDFETPYGAMGKVLARVYLYSYMRKLLEARNKTIKQFAETDQWKKLLQK